MTTHIFGVGPGLFILLAIWVLAAFIFLISLRIEKRIGAAALIIASIITIVLVSIPRSPQQQLVHEEKPYDHFFIWRLVLLILLAFSATVAVIGYVKFGLADLARPVRIRNWVI